MFAFIRDKFVSQYCMILVITEKYYLEKYLR